ncbi:hypothetical protein VTO42DRAFT_1919 [Malbranchea cinnamomea]
MATVKRSKTMPADGQTAKFLYTILKQLDLKSIDWNLVASQLEITNGHAARMRFSRFRQHMEGIPTNPRGSRPKKHRTEKAAAQSKKQMFAKGKLVEDPAEPIKQEPMIKQEPRADPMTMTPTYGGYPMPPASGMYVPPSSYPPVTVAPSDLTLSRPAPPDPVGYPFPPTGANLARIKREPSDQSTGATMPHLQFAPTKPTQDVVVKEEPREDS